MQLPLFDPIKVPLTQGYVALINQCDSDLLDHAWHALTKASSRTIYAQRNSCDSGRRTKVKMHRIILSRILGRPLLRTEEVDHIDLDGLNNQRNNLRLVTHTQNSWNSRRQLNNASGYKGVSRRKHGCHWRATITINGKQIYLGGFKTPELAHIAYCEAARKFYGEFAREK